MSNYIILSQVKRYKYSSQINVHMLIYLLFINILSKACSHFYCILNYIKFYIINMRYYKWNIINFILKFIKFIKNLLSYFTEVKLI